MNYLCIRLIFVKGKASVMFVTFNVCLSKNVWNLVRNLFVINQFYMLVLVLIKTHTNYQQLIYWYITNITGKHKLSHDLIWHHCWEMKSAA